MADVDSVVYTTTERKVRKVKKTTKRRESHDNQNASEVTITELDSTQNNHHAIEEYVLADRYTAVPADPLLLLLLIVSSFLLLLTATRYYRCRVAIVVRFARTSSSRKPPVVIGNRARKRRIARRAITF